MIEKDSWCTAKTLAGLEEPLAQELMAMGYKNVKAVRRAVEFQTDLKGIYLANLNLRNALSVLVSLLNIRFSTNEDLYEQVKNFPWEKWFKVQQTFSVKSTVFSKNFDNSNYASLLVKDAIVDRFRMKSGRRPNVDRERPDIIIDVYISEDKCIVSLNSSGSPLYMRSYRNMGFEAPLNECLAAGLLSLSGWNKSDILIDPMCGSGSIAIEGAMMAAKMHPQKMRKHFSFMNWSFHDERLFDAVRGELEAAEEIPSIPVVFASDLSIRAVSITRNSLFELGLSGCLEVEKKNFLKSSPKHASGVIIMNPPYDERMKEDDITGLYKEIGNKLKQDYANHRAWILSANEQAIKSIGLKPFKKLDLFNGNIPCKFLGFDLYQGSKKGSTDL